MKKLQNEVAAFVEKTDAFIQEVQAVASRGEVSQVPMLSLRGEALRRHAASLSEDAARDTSPGAGQLSAVLALECKNLDTVLTSLRSADTAARLAGEAETLAKIARVRARLGKG